MYVSLPIVPNCIYTDPEIATVGITEEIAREKGLKVRCGHFFHEGKWKIHHNRWGKWIYPSGI